VDAIAKRREFRSISFYQGCVGKPLRTVFPKGIDTDPLSVIRMSASGVASIAFAKNGFVLLCTIPSEMLPPYNNDPIETAPILAAPSTILGSTECCFKSRSVKIEDVTRKRTASAGADA
jgi:hypothetical protein